jgi:lipopolysaccharide transport system ATP-binding protein
MSDLVISARDLRKVYRLYRGPMERFLDMFGLLKRRPGAFTEHAALDGVSLDIARGEKVAFIGRNGAGKSTLLKLITRVIEPTAGTLDVKAHAHALLQIGSGFHPDFTGRDNVYAYLAQLGVTGAEADRKFADIVAFAELEEYIGQPVKTYSSGMAVRLMFSVSTAITPDLLVLDEVLGVGDAYFAQKSYDRIRELCSGAGTTLLLVTHDIYSAMKICDRVIWIDHGRIALDGAAQMVVRAYENSIKHQEEQRLRTRKLQRLAEATAEIERDGSRVIVEVHAEANRPLKAPVHFRRIGLVQAGRTIADAPFDERAFDESRPTHLVRDGSCWGTQASIGGVPCGTFDSYGSPFRKVTVAMAVPAGTVFDDLSVAVEYQSAAPTDLRLQVFAPGQQRNLGLLPAASEEWTHVERPLDTEHPVPSEQALRSSAEAIQGTGVIKIADISVVDETGAETFQVEHGQPLAITMDYEIAQAELRERAQVVIALHREGTLTACRFIARDLLFDAAAARRGRIRLHVPKLTLADGEYAISVMLAREGYYDQPQTVFYSLNPGVYYCLNRVLQLTVSGAGLIGAGAVFVPDGEWTLER